MIVELITVSTEILLGNIVNTNAAFLSEKCAALGFSVHYQITVGEDMSRLEEAIRTASSRSDIIILSGGPGTTNDDIIKKAAANVVGKIHCIYDNHGGTAPGVIMENDKCTIIFLPGSPSELKTVFDKYVVSYLRSRTEKEFHATPENIVVELLKKKKYHITTVESCTGGKIAARLVGVSGASEVFEQGYVTYSDRAKCNMVEVDENIIHQYGVVSSQTAAAMAECGAKKSGAEVAVSVTGIAGPGGGTERTPVGTVYIGCHVPGKTVVEHYCFSGNRENVREKAAIRALDLVRQNI